MIEKDELVRILNEEGIEDSENYIKDLMKKIDFNKTNKIDFTEFLISNLNY